MAPVALSVAAGSCRSQEASRPGSNLGSVFPTVEVTLDNASSLSATQFPPLPNGANNVYFAGFETIKMRCGCKYYSAKHKAEGH